MSIRLKPDVDRRWLFGIAGLVWSLAGVILLVRTVIWLLGFSVPLAAAAGVAGALGAGVVTRYMFRKIVTRNVERIDSGPDRACVFAFQEWKSYAMMALMIGMGVTLRHYAAPRSALAVGLAIVYETMGGALLLASVVYHRRFFRAIRVLEG